MKGTTLTAATQREIGRLHTQVGNPRMFRTWKALVLSFFDTRRIGGICYILHRLAEQAISNFDTDNHPHQTAVARSDLLLELACLAFHIQPCFSEPEDLQAAAVPLMTERLPDIVPITEDDFKN